MKKTGLTGAAVPGFFGDPYLLPASLTVSASWVCGVDGSLGEFRVAPAAEDLPGAEVSQTVCSTPSNESYYIGSGQGPEGDLNWLT